MTTDEGIILDLFPPLGWGEEDIRTALEIAEEVDGDNNWGFTLEDMAYLAKAISYYMNTPPAEWQGRFEMDSGINQRDPHEDGRYVIDMSYPSHLEPPSTLR
jgi:hypothetical protein